MFRDRPFRDRPHRSTAAIAAALLAALTLTACAGDGSVGDSQAASRSDAAGDSAKSGSPAPSDGFANGAGSAPGDAQTEAKTGKPAETISRSALQATQEQLARRASVALQVKSIGQAVAKVRAAAAAAEGIVLSENIGTGDGAVPLTDSSRISATTYGEITISVPSTKLDTVVADLASIGKVIRSTSSSENVGGQIVDTQSRLETMRVSVERVRKFLEEAKDLSQTVQLEAELTRRQSDLEALEAQLASLKGSVARSPVQVSLTTEPGVIADADATGFLAGLEDGWKAFTASVSVVLTVLGAVLPFAVVLALLGFPVWWILRRRRALTPPPTVLPE